MHCVAGDGVGILAGAIIGWLFVLPAPAEIALEYALGFGFGWAIFQALFMRDMAGGSFLQSMRQTFMPELLSMNCLMGGMVPMAAFARGRLPEARNAMSPEFWFVMSMALLLGFCIAYPMNWWLVTRHLKHGMMTVRRLATGTPNGMAHHGRGHVGTDAAKGISGSSHAPHHAHAGSMEQATVTTVGLLASTVVSFIVLGIGLALVPLLG
jgi:hypothetical protein